MNIYWDCQGGGVDFDFVLGGFFLVIVIIYMESDEEFYNVLILFNFVCNMVNFQEGNFCVIVLFNVCVE